METNSAHFCRVFVRVYFREGRKNVARIGRFGAAWIHSCLLGRRGREEDVRARRERAKSERGNSCALLISIGERKKKSSRREAVLIASEPAIPKNARVKSGRTCLYSSFFKEGRN